MNKYFYNIYLILLFIIYIMDIKKIMKDQPIINIGMIGHVSNGKSTIVKSLTGKSTQAYSNEKERNITIKLGYANSKIYKCNICESPENYVSTSSDIYKLNCKFCNTEMELVNHISFTDCPGHWNLMSTMLNGTCVMDYTILVESLHNENIPSPQTIEHVKATTMTNTPNKIICINKLDLVKRDDVHDKLDIFKKYAKNTILEKSPIVPIVASKGLNIDILCQELARLPIPERKINNNFKMIIIRSFNANKPGTSIFDLNGGVIGGSLVNGLVNKNDEVILKPGFIINNTKFNNQNDDSKKWIYSPIRAKILSINSEKNQLESAIPGGLIGVQLDIDPSIATNDNLAGNLMLSPNIENEYSVFEDVEIEFHNFDNKNISFKQGDKLYINANANNQLCSVLRHKKNKIVLNLLLHPICVKIGDCVTISINSQNSEGITIIGSGIVIKGNPSELLK